MLFSPRMSLKQLAGFSQRASMCLLAGIDERTICAREVKNAHGFAARRHLTSISQTGLEVLGPATPLVVAALVEPPVVLRHCIVTPLAGVAWMAT